MEQFCIKCTSLTVYLDVSLKLHKSQENSWSKESWYKDESRS